MGPSATSLKLDIHAQPDDTTCGPTCLHAVYRYYGDRLALDRVIRETPTLEDGGTLAVFLALHALKRGYRATIYTYNLQVFDPTWFARGGPDIRDRLGLQARQRRSPKLRAATAAYLEFLELGGRLRFKDLTPELIRRPLRRGVPILTGLNATYLYRCARERSEGDRVIEDDLGGDPMGHFVVIHGYDRDRKEVHVADPLASNPVAPGHRYTVDVGRVICAILLGIVTYDANLLLLEAPETPPEP
jgi:hypothetical protein